MIRGKRGIELSVGFVVMLILGIVVFGLSIGLMGKIIGNTQKIQTELDAQTQARLEALLDDGSRVAVPFTKKEVSRGDVATFGIGVLNVESIRKFSVTLTQGTAYDSDGNPISNPETKAVLLFQGINEEAIESNDKRSFLAAVDVKKNADSGTYVFNLNVKYDKDEDGNVGSNEFYIPTKKLYVIVS